MCYRKCTTPGCDGKLHYDGCTDGLLNLGHTLVGHEVLIRFMFGFLMGRFVTMLRKITFYDCINISTALQCTQSMSYYATSIPSLEITRSVQCFHTEHLDKHGIPT